MSISNDGQQPPDPRDKVGQYIIVPNRKAGGSGRDLAELIAAITRRTDVQFEVKGSPEQPLQVKLRADERCIGELRERFGQRLFIEVDHPLQMF